MREKIKNLTISWVVLSILYVLLGISLAVWPSFVMGVICYVFGAIFCTERLPSMDFAVEKSIKSVRF